MDLAQIERDSDERIKRKIKKAREIEIANFDVSSDVEKLPYDEQGLIFKQQGKRIIWMKETDKYCSARYYPSEECAVDVIDELIRLGHPQSFKDYTADEEQMELF